MLFLRVGHQRLKLLDFFFFLRFKSLTFPDCPILFRHFFLGFLKRPAKLTLAFF